jgi:hypothetical protein
MTIRRKVILLQRAQNVGDAEAGSRLRARQKTTSRLFSRAGTSSIADHDRADARTIPAVAIPIAIAVPIMITVAIPECAPITITIVVIIVREEATRAADAVVANPATYALDLLDDARLVLRQSSAGEADRIRAIGQQRRAHYGGGGQGDKQKLVHLRTSRLSAVRAWSSPTKFQSWASSTTIV